MRTRVVLVIFAILVPMGLLLYDRQNDDDCGTKGDIKWCYVEKTRAIADTEGLATALAYVLDTVAPMTDYMTAHLALHYVGAQAFEEQGTVEAAIRYLRSAHQNTADKYYVGYQHGVFQAFFVENSADSTRDLAQEVCKPYMNITDIRTSTSTTLKMRAPECYHSVGHALMMIHENDLVVSLGECDALLQTWQKEWCYHGAFMENVYLDAPYYEATAQRPYVTDESFLQLCKTLDARYQPQCHQFITWAEFFKHGDRFESAFEDCRKLPKNEARICAARTGRYPIAISHTDDFERIRTTCALANEYEKECLYGTAIGLSQGIGNITEYDAGSKLCSLLGPDAQECVKMVKRADESLERFVAAEL